MPLRAASAAYAALFAELLAGPSTIKELIAATGMHYNTVSKFVQAMRRVGALEFVGKENRQYIYVLKGWKDNEL